MKPLRYFVLCVFGTLLSLSTTIRKKAVVQPNVIIVMTDDQGYGDLGLHGNDIITTPRIDAFAKEGIRFNNFYVSPVCTPTRASLLTGRYSLRTGVFDTYNGGAIMASNEFTIAEILRDAGYSTGIFGKWHLGDNFPSRAMDQGFEESLVHLGGGIGQIGDFTNYSGGRDSSYFDPVLWHNGKPERYEGYCTDIFTDQALDFIENKSDEPFFCYLAFNAPHGPLQLPQEYFDPYSRINPRTASDQPIRYDMNGQDVQDARRVYGMVTNVDWNFGRLLDKLEELKLTDNTIVLFLTDNGPQQPRYNNFLRARKGSVYEGGVRVPFFIRYPSGLTANKDISFPSAHLDVLPTLIDLCHVEESPDLQLDGTSLAPIIQGEEADWPDRSLLSYWSRGLPVRYRNMAIRKSDFKLVGQTESSLIESFELYNIALDPTESQNILPTNLGIARELKKEMDSLFSRLLLSKNITTKPLTLIGSANENPTILNRINASGEVAPWNQEEVAAHWDVNFARGRYNFKIQFLNEVEAFGKLTMQVGDVLVERLNDKSTQVIDIPGIEIPESHGELSVTYTIGDRSIFPMFVEVELFSNHADLISFSFSEDLPIRSFKMDSINRLMTFTVTEGAEIGELTPMIEISAGATISPVSGESQDFTVPVEYRITSQDSTRSSIWTVRLDEVLSTTPHSEISQMVAYPNPAHNWLTVEIPQDLQTQDAHLELYNMQGYRVRELPIEKEAKTLNMPIHEITAGLYLLQLVSNGQAITSKMVLFR